MNFVVFGFAKNLHRKTKKESHIQTVHFTSPALVDKTCIWVEHIIMISNIIQEFTMCKMNRHKIWSQIQNTVLKAYQL